MYQFPIRIPDGWKLTITQGFADTSLASWYASKGIHMPEHNGVDVVCGTGIQTFGSACIWPFPFPGKVYDAQAESPVASETKHAHSQIDGIDPNTGISYSVIYLHLSAVTETKATTETKEIIYNQGDVIGYIGNSGAVLPAPTPQSPFNGAHLHLGLGIKKPGEANSTMVDPSLYFDVNNPFRGNDDPSRDDAVASWAAAHGGVPTPVQTKHVFNTNLYFGMPISGEVTALQTALQTLKDRSGNPFLKVGTFGPYGPATKDAVARFQAENGISDDGSHFGPQTRAAMNSALSTPTPTNP